MFSKTHYIFPTVLRRIALFWLFLHIVWLFFHVLCAAKTKHILTRIFGDRDPSNHLWTWGLKEKTGEKMVTNCDRHRRRCDELAPFEIFVFSDARHLTLEKNGKW